MKQIAKATRTSEILTKLQIDRYETLSLFIYIYIHMDLLDSTKALIPAGC